PAPPGRRVTAMPRTAPLSGQALAGGSPDGRRFFHTLDGLRGAAALAVVILHDPGFVLPLVMPSAYLAVDFFFLLSGFVLAHAYGSRLAGGLTLRRFLRDRLVRFYPLYFLGLMVGAVSGAVALALGGGSMETLQGLLIALGTGLAFLPSPTAHETPGIFPLNSPGWSLFFELLVNMLFACLLPYLSLRRLLAITLLAAVALVWSVLEYGNLDTGSAWFNVWGGFARVGFSFFAGVLLYRLHRQGFVTSRLAWMLPLLLMAILMVEVPPEYRRLFDLAMVMLAFPALLLVSSMLEPGRFLAPVFLRLGALSFPIYAIHFPVQELLRRCVRFLDIDPVELAPWAGLVVLPAMIAVSLWLARHYDRPLQRRLRQRRELKLRLATIRVPG
ncbi:acyltransferase, partial [Roseomonas sp. 18066]|uniref:acyltransferase family protein n=1 Tax=Roseomonas sp. 18066 TaxID=2681412 RepID=UPI001F2256B7